MRSPFVSEGWQDNLLRIQYLVNDLSRAVASIDLPKIVDSQRPDFEEQRASVTQKLQIYTQEERAIVQKLQRIRKLQRTKEQDWIARYGVDQPPNSRPGRARHRDVRQARRPWTVRSQGRT